LLARNSPADPDLTVTATPVASLVTVFYRADQVATCCLSKRDAGEQRDCDGGNKKGYTSHVLSPLLD
jgi:hypothetical protein